MTEYVDARRAVLDKPITGTEWYARSRKPIPTPAYVCAVCAAPAVMAVQEMKLSPTLLDERGCSVVESVHEGAWCADHIVARTLTLRHHPDEPGDHEEWMPRFEPSELPPWWIRGWGMDAI